MTQFDNRLEQIGAIIFDCDGTLVDSEPITVQVLVDQVGEFGLKLEYDEALGLFVGRDMAMILVELEKRTDRSLPEDFVDEFRRRQAIELQRSVTSIPGASELLSVVSVGKSPICVASNAPRAKIELNLQATDLSQFFPPSHIFSAYDVNKWKPDPTLFLHVAQQLGVPPEDCVVIEDSLAGIEAGIAAGMQTIGYAASASQQPTDKVRFVHHLADLIPVLG